MHTYSELADSRLGLVPESESTDVVAALAVWRRKAADILLAVVAAVQLPVIVVVVLGKGPPLGSLTVALAIASGLAFVVAAVFRRVELGNRLAIFFTGAVLAIASMNLVLPAGPVAQVGLVTLPLLVLILVGPRAAKMASLGCLAIVVLAPLLRQQPAVCRALAIGPAGADPAGTIWVRAAEMAGLLVGSLVLLDRFHHFLLETLAAQFRARAELKQESLKRAAAQQKVENEMRERQRLEREIAAVSDGERRRLGQELHDGVCQQVAAALLRSKALERRVEKGGAPTAGDFHGLSSLLAETIDDARNVALGLCPLEPDPEALAPALRALTKRTQEMSALRCEFSSSGDVHIPDPAMAQHLYRIAQEALSNAVRHANAHSIAVALKGSDGQLTLQVEDDGAGMPVDYPSGGMGLRTMAYRAEILAGELKVTPAEGGGTCVTCRVPRAKTHDSGGRRCLPAA